MKIKPGSEIFSHVILTSVISVYSMLDIFTEVVSWLVNLGVMLVVKLTPPAADILAAVGSTIE